MKKKPKRVSFTLGELIVIAAMIYGTYLWLGPAGGLFVALVFLLIYVVG